MNAKSDEQDYKVELAPPESSRRVKFYKDGVEVGMLDLNPDKMTFTGDCHESAEVFFDAVLSKFAFEVAKLSAEK